MRFLPIVTAVLATAVFFVPLIFLLAIVSLAVALPAIDAGHAGPQYSPTPMSLLAVLLMVATELAVGFVLWRRFRRASVKANIILIIVFGALFAVAVLAGPGRLVLLVPYAMVPYLFGLGW